MAKLRKRRFADAVWIPLRASQSEESRFDYGHAGYVETFFGAGSVAIPLSKRAEGDDLSWMDIGLIHYQGVVAGEKGYKPVHVYSNDDITELGTELVLEQDVGGNVPKVWHLNQDLVFALRLYREADTWVCPSEDFVDVVHLRRDQKGRPTLLEIRAEFLRDYLAARQMALRIASYRSHKAVLEDATHIKWPDEDQDVDGGRLSTRVIEIHEGGHPYGEAIAVFHASRTDVDPAEDVPEMGPPTNGNVESKSWEVRNKGRKLYHVEGEFWRDEWIEPAPSSPRVRGDEPSSTVSYVVDASGKRMSSAELDNEDIGRWLWFAPAVIPALVNRRAGSLIWHTLETGGVRASTDYSHTHFGINEKNLITVYAYDVAKLPQWQQRIWAGYNVSPDGKVSAELLASQAEAKPAKTKAPEALIPILREHLNEAFESRWGTPLFREHESTSDLLRSSHRFRAQDRAGLLALAKDLARLTADSIDVSPLHALAPLKKDEKRGSLRSLELALATMTSDREARQALSQLVGIYELRLGDAHLPGDKLNEAFRLAGVDVNAPPIQQGVQLLNALAQSFFAILKIIETQSTPTS